MLQTDEAREAYSDILKKLEELLIELENLKTRFDDIELKINS
tara:strand:+ start:3372 stop:3497 length:126 start_codon:yes stop_codon:yes gene_type:complete